MFTLFIYQDASELKQELIRKDELIQKHYEKLAQWQAILNRSQANPTGSGGNWSMFINSLWENCSCTAVNDKKFFRKIFLPVKAWIRSNWDKVYLLLERLCNKAFCNQLRIKCFSTSWFVTGPAQAQVTSQQAALSHQQQAIQQQQPPSMIQQQQQHPQTTPAQQSMVSHMTTHSAYQPQGPLHYLEQTTSNIGMPERRWNYWTF